LVVSAGGRHDGLTNESRDQNMTFVCADVNNSTWHEVGVALLSVQEATHVKNLVETLQGLLYHHRNTLHITLRARGGGKGRMS
jgi:hypothetical protein